MDLEAKLAAYRARKQRETILSNFHKKFCSVVPLFGTARPNVQQSPPDQSEEQQQRKHSQEHPNDRPTFGTNNNNNIVGKPLACHPSCPSASKIGFQLLEPRNNTEATKIQAICIYKCDHLLDLESSTSDNSSNNHLHSDSDEADEDFPANKTDTESPITGTKSITYLTYIVGFIFWATCYVIAIELQFGVIFLICSALIGIYFNTRTDPKPPGEISAYSVFNQNCRAIDGALSAEQFEREMRYGPGSLR